MEEADYPRGSIDLFLEFVDCEVVAEEPEDFNYNNCRKC